MARTKKIDFTRWILGVFDDALLASPGNSQGAITTSSQSTSTLLRSRGELLVGWAAAAAIQAGDVTRVGVGFLVQQEGATATQLPLTDAFAPWLWYWVGTMQAQVDEGEGRHGILGAARVVIDNKAMRILRPGMEIVCVAEALAIVGNGEVQVSVAARLLLGT